MLDDLMEQLAENKTTAIIVGCVVAIGANLGLGGADLWGKKMANNAMDESARGSQERAETIFSEQGCIAQAINQRTGNSNFLPGDIAIDPLSKTVENPNGTAINTGYVCGSDGSLLLVNGGVVSLVGSSPKIRKFLVAQGFIDESKKMEQRAKTYEVRQ